MAQDRFVRFKEKAPSRADLETILRNYFGGCGLITGGDDTRWCISLPGIASSPFTGVEGARPLGLDDPDRWIEVVFTQGKEANVDVLTRRQDEFTNGIADQLARALARFYSAKLEMG
jgi:hypothetical protein